MRAESKDEAFGELLEALETAATPADKFERVRLMGDKWEPAFPGIRAEFESMAGLARLFQKPAPPPQHLPLPSSLPGFLDLTPIGAGGYGVVCSATQLPFRRKVAVKIRSAGASASAEERFDREQRVLARLHHTNIVPVHLSGRHGPYQFFVMNLIDGATLADLVGTLSDQTAPPAAISTLADHAARSADTRSREKLPASVPSGLVPPPSVAPSDAPAASSFPVPPPASYFRSVAAVIAAAADALAHAHAADVLHRDIKPSNIMVGRDGVCSIIDFGLAGLAAGDDDPDHPRGGDALTQGALGTTPYMAPEQFHRKPEARSDVWGLGATLYELLTLRRAYPRGAFRDAAATTPADVPPPPRTVCAAVPPDLEAICLKALRRDAAERYASPADMADDLRRWQRGETTAALPRSAVVRATKWAKRNPGWAGMLASLAACVVIGAAAGVWSARASAAEANAKAAEVREKSAKELEQERQREALVMSIQGKRLGRLSDAGWYERLLPEVRKAAGLRNDEPLRSQAVALLTSIDAVRRPSFPDLIGSSVAFDDKGRLLIGGFFDPDRRVSHTAHLWDGTLQKPLASKQLGPGPAAFRADGTPLQLAVTPEDRNTLALWDMGGQKLVRRLVVPGAKKKDPPTADDPGARPVLSSDGKFAAAIVGARVGPVYSFQTVVWDTATGAVLFSEIPESTPSAVTVGPADADGKSFVAVGDTQGRVTTWSLPEGNKLSTLSVDHGSVNALAVGRDVLRHDRRVLVPALRNRLLAVSGGTGRVSVWELETSSVRSFSHGSPYGVFSLAFSPDGVTLASAGRDQPRLWDVATGRLLLELGSMDYIHGVTFSTDGKTVAYTGRNVFTPNRGTHLWSVEDGRGTQTLRGLVGSVQRAWWSPDGNLVACVSHDWRVAVWDRRAGRLLHVFEVPQSSFVDNVCVAFSSDGRQLAYAGGRAAFLWDLTTGKELKDWKLPEGLSNQLIFAAADKLYLFRQESRDPLRGPYGDPIVNPRVCRIRNLLADPTKLILDSPALSWAVQLASASASESCFVVEGSENVGGKPVRFIKAFDAATGNELWANPSRLPVDGAGSPTMDPKGEFVAVSPAPGRFAVLRVRTGKEVEESADGYHALGTPGGFYVGPGGMLFRRGDKTPLFRLAIDDTRTHPPHMWFDPSGTRVAWVTTEGVVRVCDLTAAQERLAAVGLNW